MRHQLTQAGDTIVEVLISIALISLILLGAYVSTNHSLANTQDAQERSQGVKLIQTQVEALRLNGTITSGYCFDGTGAPQPPSDPACTATPNGPGTQPAYTLSVTGPDVNGVFSVNARWDSLASKNQDTESVFYHP